MSKIVVICIQGLIAAGKSTLASILSNILNQNGIHNEIAYEPVDEWIKTGALTALYENPERMSCVFQSFALVTRVKEIKRAYNVLKSKPGNLKVLIMDRDNESDKIFAMLLKQNMTSVEFEIYKTWCDEWKELISEINILPKITIILGTSVRECSRRLISRGREMESKISEEYQTSLNDIHEKYFIYDNLELKRDKSTIVKWVPSSIADKEIKTEHINEIMNYVFDEFTDENFTFMRLLFIH
jgi:deoxyadenosine/deoxycytidine kinase